MTMKTRTFALLTSAVAAAMVLAGCSTGAGTDMQGMDHNPSASPTASTGAFNDGDTAFAMNMIAHHRQAIEMSDMLLEKEGVDERVVEVATAIKEAQEPEIELMTEWLNEWGQPTHSGMDHGGMMSAEDMAALQAATGAEASQLFLEQMIEHHKGAIDMAEIELGAGENVDALALASKIIDDQTAEIAAMQQFLDTL
jgi:uncharacterized protein (DUF305 family)